MLHKNGNYEISDIKCENEHPKAAIIPRFEFNPAINEIWVRAVGVCPPKNVTTYLGLA